jgi:metallophosphoesterase superfamily enzyme
MLFPNRTRIIPNWGHEEATGQALTGIHKVISHGHGALRIVDEVEQRRAIRRVLTEHTAGKQLAITPYLHAMLPDHTQRTMAS